MFVFGRVIFHGAAMTSVRVDKDFNGDDFLLFIFSTGR